jgi:hypothetical protein
MGILGGVLNRAAAAHSPSVQRSDNAALLLPEWFLGKACDRLPYCFLS